MRPRSPLSVLSTVALLLSSWFAPPARAEEPRATEPLLVWVDLNGSSLQPERLRHELTLALKREVVLTVDERLASLHVRLLRPRRAQVRRTTDQGESVEREVDLPADARSSLEVLSWLTVNLVRDEATELLEELRMRRKREADARAAAERAAAERAAAERAAAERAAAERAAAERAAAERWLREPHKSFDLALATPISLQPDSARRELFFQLALLYGLSGGVRGGAVSPGVLRVRQDLRGFAAGTVVTLVAGDARGALLSAGYADVAGDLTGVQLAGGASVQRGVLARGVLVGGGAVVAGDLDGVALAGGLAVTRRLRGLSSAAGFVLARGRVDGALLGAGATFAGAVRGVQVAAGINVSRDLSGVAIAPLNVQRKVRGLQLGIVNVAEEVDGAAIGLISFAKNGRLQPVLWFDSGRSLHVALKSIAGWAFTQVGGGLDLRADELSYDAGVGAHLRVGRRLFLEPGVHYSGRQAVDAQAAQGLDVHDVHYLVGGGLRLGAKVDVLVAAGPRHTVAGAGAGAWGASARAGLAFF
jgi:hypothetical protein